MSADSALQKLCKWRNVFAGWQLGTRAKTDGESRAVRDHRELSIILRVEVTAMTDLLIQNGLITPEEFQAAVEREAIQLDKDYERRFPGFSTSLDGVHMKMPEVAETMRKMGFPP